MLDRRTFAALCTALAATALAPVRAGAAPTLAPLVRYGDWLADRPTATTFAGKVVLVDVFTFGCYNCKNVTPNLRALYKKRDLGLEIVGVHTPETPYEQNRANVVENLGTLGIVWPVAVDNAHTLWNAYAVEYWPTQLIFDRHGTLRKTVIGDSQDALVNDTISKLLAEK
ncbi:MAG: redoxin family protein [Candidatus Eremiobacteraeota bacterium]|nr:redoxin family protein [Candidatus Eremiobacteraeota bacterium]